ncbi:MAG: hypothetical protein RXR08_14105 [Sulfolobaceae archaeon]
MKHFYLKFLNSYVDKVSEKIGYNLSSDGLVRVSRKLIPVSEILTPVLVAVFFHLTVVLILALGFLAFIHLLPLVYAYSKSAEYSIAVDKATMYIAMSAYILTLTGKDLTAALRVLTDKGDKVSKTELKVIETKMSFLGKSLTNAVKERMDMLKGTHLSELYSVYLTTKELGLSMPVRLDMFIRDLVNDLGIKSERRAFVLVDLSEAILTVFILFPMMALTLSFLSSINFQFNVTGNYTFLMLFPLIIAPGLYFIVSQNSISPEVKPILSLLEKVLIASFFPLSFLIVFLKLNPSLIVILFGLLIALPVYVRHYLVAEKVFALQPALLSALGDQMRLGYNVKESWRRAVTQLENVSKSVRKILSPEGVKEMPFVNDIWRITQIAYEGSYYAVFDEMSRVANKIVSTYKTYQNRVRPLLAVALAAPAVLIFTVHVLMGISANVDLYKVSFLINLDLLGSTVLFSKAVKGSPFYFPLYLAVGLESLLFSVLWF